MTKTPPVAAPETAPPDRDAAIKKAAADIARLAGKYDLYQSRLQAAASAGDALAIADIHREYAALPTAITAAEVRLLTLRIDRAEAKAPAARAAVHAAGGTLQQAQEALAAAQAVYREAEQAHYVARMEVDTLAREIADCRRHRAEKLEALTAVPAPVVRSLAHAGAAGRNGR
jgi:chromosome segregation ATPase